MKAFLLAAALSTISGISFAQDYGSHYDWQSGNQYQWQRDGTGTSVQGYNYGTGSNWRMRQNNDGTYSGTDAAGNYFTGNNNTGYYNNFGTGRTCYGTGMGRTCY